VPAITGFPIMTAGSDSIIRFGIVVAMLPGALGRRARIMPRRQRTAGSGPGRTLAPTLRGHRLRHDGGMTSDERGSRLLTRKTVYPGRTVHLDLERVELPNGATHEFEIVHHPGAACVVPFVTRDDVLLLRQFRHAAGRWLVEAPAGKLDPGEPPESCARRELEEETGHVAGRLTSLGFIHVSPGFCDEVIHLFAAEDLAPGRACVEESECLELLRVPFAEALDMAHDGRITDAKTIAALARAARRLGP
jgi:ADP-ribose pyrophosphatase